MPKVFLNDQQRACHRFATWIKGEKKLKNMTDTELAKQHGISQSAMSKKLREESFSFDDFVFFVRTFGMNEQDFRYIVGK